MRIKELLEAEQVHIPHLYLDMDGVQSDFFGAWAARHGVHHFKAIPDRETAINELAHSTAQNVYSFFHDLHPLREGRKVINWLNKHHIPYTVLSAPLRGPYSAASIKAKKSWLDRYNPGTSDTAIFVSDKHKYAIDPETKKPNVLVDDFGKYINAWKDAGGIAIKHEDEHEVSNSGDLTIKKLKQIYDPFIEEKT